MVKTLQSQISFMSLFRSIESAFAGFMPIYRYLHNPFTLMRANPQQTCFVSFSRCAHILKISEPCDLSKIAKSIVQFISVYMIYMLNRPFARYVCPSQSMRQLFTVINRNAPIACGLFSSRNMAYNIRSIFMFTPGKYACVNIVKQNITQMFYRAWYFNCHDNSFIIRMYK